VALGVHAVLSNHVVRRRREIGLRLALGAERSRVISEVLGSGMHAALLGVAIGAVIGAGSLGLLEALLFGVDGPTAGILLVPALAVAGASALAAISPALRAGRTAPADVLREE
jgi:putative ABC transport system permease protein